MWDWLIALGAWIAWYYARKLLDRLPGTKAQLEPEPDPLAELETAHRMEIREWDLQMESLCGKPVRYLLDPALEEKEKQERLTVTQGCYFESNTYTRPGLRGDFEAALAADFGQSNAYAALRQRQLEGALGQPQLSQQNLMAQALNAQLGGQGQGIQHPDLFAALLGQHGRH